MYSGMTVSVSFPVYRNVSDEQCLPLLSILKGCTSLGATSGVTVSMSAFLACHQCYCAGSSLAWGLNLQAVVCGIF